MKNFLLGLIITLLFVTRCTYSLNLSATCTGTCQDPLKDKVEATESTITVYWEAPELSPDTPLNFSLWWGYSPQSHVSLVGYFTQSAKVLDGKLQLSFPEGYIPTGDYYHIAVLPGATSSNSTTTPQQQTTPQAENLLGPIKYYRASDDSGTFYFKTSVSVSVCPSTDTGSCGDTKVVTIDTNEIHVKWAIDSTDSYDAAEISLYWGNPVVYLFGSNLGSWKGEITNNQVLSVSPYGGDTGVNLPIEQDIPPGSAYYVVVSLKRTDSAAVKTGVNTANGAAFTLTRSSNDQDSGSPMVTMADLVTMTIVTIVSIYLVL